MAYNPFSNSTFKLYINGEYIGDGELPKTSDKVTVDAGEWASFFSGKWKWSSTLQNVAEDTKPLG